MGDIIPVQVGSQGMVEVEGFDRLSGVKACSPRENALTLYTLVHFYCTIRTLR